MDYGNSNFGGGGGFMSPTKSAGSGGGGFVSPSGQNDSNFKQDVSPNSKRMMRDKKSLRPVTINQLNTVDAKQDGEGFTLDGIDLDQVKLVGCITNIEEGTAHLNITLHDGYNQTTVKRWSDGEENEFEARKRAQLQIGTFVQVVGQLKSLGQQRQLQSFDIRPLNDYNEITHHMLDSVYTTLLLTHQLQIPTMGNQNNQMNQDVNIGARFSQQNAPNISGPNLTAQQSGGDQDPNVQRVLELFKELGEGENGASINDVAKRMKENYNVNFDQVRKIVDILFFEGHVYSTIDENEHYAATE